MYDISYIIPYTRVSFFSFLLYFFSIFIFLYYYHYQYKRHGVVSVSTAWLIFNYFFSFILEFLFAFSDLNSVASPNFSLYFNEINDVYAISFLGFICFVLGSILSRKVNFHPPMFKFVVFNISNFWVKKASLILIIPICCAVILFFIGKGVPFGEGRSFAMDNPSIRPVINFSSTFLSFAFFLVLINLYKKLNIIAAFLAGLMIFINLWFGTRSTIFFPLVSLFLTHIVVKNDKNILKYITIAFVLVPFVLVLGMLRHTTNVYDVLEIGFEFLYGNTFSDLRDFAWVYHYWNGEYLLGKTYAAAILSIFPGFFSEFRSEWSWGRFSTLITALNSDVHPGLRPGPFGEVFFNFGCLGVIILSSIMGFLIGRLDQLILKVKILKGAVPCEFVAACFIYSSLLSPFMISANFFSIYVNFGFLMVGYIMIIFFSRRKLYNVNS